MKLFCVVFRKTGCGGTEAVPPEDGASPLIARFLYWMVVPLIEVSGKVPLYQGPTYPVGTATPAMLIAYPTTTLLSGALSVTVTRLPASLIAVMLAVWFNKLGTGIVVTAPNPTAILDWNIGVKDETTSLPPGSTVPALATNTLESLGRMAECVGLMPKLGFEGS